MTGNTEFGGFWDMRVGCAHAGRSRSETVLSRRDAAAVATRTLPSSIPMTDEFRHLVTMRLTRWLMGQNLQLSLFSYYSPSDNDGYLRPHILYRLDDAWFLEL